MTEPKWELTLSVTDRNNIGLIQPRKNNTNSELMRVHVTNKNGEPYDLTAFKVFFVTHFTGKDSLNVPVQKEAKIIDAKDGIFEFIFNEDCMQKVGRQKAYFEIYDYDKFLDATQNFTYEIIQSSRQMKADFTPYIETWEEAEKMLDEGTAKVLTDKTEKLELQKANVDDVNEQLRKQKQETDNKLEKKTNNDTFVAITADMQRQIESTQSGFIGEFDSLEQLNLKYPKGEKGYVIVWLNENGQKVGYTYTYKNGSWVKGNVWNGVGIPKDSVDRIKIKKSAVNYAKTNFLELDTTVNLFDGDYESNLQLNGESGGLSLRPSDGGKTAIIPIFPNTEYSIGRKVPSRFHYGTATKLIDLNQSLDGEININNSGTGETSKPQIVTFVSGANDRWLYINTSVNYEEPFLKVIQGKLDNFKEELYPVRFKEKYDVLSKTSYESDVYSPNKMSFMELNPERNYFDGDYLKGYTVNGVSGSLGFNLRDGGIVAKMEVLPNTDYWLGRDSSDVLNFATSTYEMNIGDKFDGEININMSTSANKDKFISTTFKTGINDKYLYCWVSEIGNEPLLKISEGETGKLEPVDYKQNTYLLSNEIKLPKNEESEHKIERLAKYKYDGSSKLEIIVPSKKSSKYIRYTYRLVTNVSININQWRVNNIEVLDENYNFLYSLRSDTEWEGAILEVGQDDYMGGFHGDERNVNLHILIDGKPLNLTVKSEGVFFESLRVVNESILNRVNDHNKDLLRRFKVTTWDYNTYTVENKYIALDAFEIKESKITLASVDYINNSVELINAGRKNDLFVIENLDSDSNLKTTTGKDATVLEMWSDNFYLSAESIAKEYPNRSQYFQNFGQYNYAKIYFDTTGNYQIKKDEILQVKSIYKILV